MFDEREPAARPHYGHEESRPEVRQRCVVLCCVLDEAWQIMKSMPQGSDGPFPYNAKSVSASFTRACNFLEIDDLHFQDMSHDGVSQLLGIGWDIPKAASVSGHRDWNSTRR